MSFAEAMITKHGNALHVSHGDDSGLHVEFENRAIHQAFESEKEGRAIFKEVPYITIMFPGDRTKTICRPVKHVADGLGPADPDRFPRHWAAFLAQAEQVQTGTPIEEWGPITRSQAMELKSLHIHTVEQLAAMADSALVWMGSRDLREKARTWIEQAKGGAEAMRLQRENDLLRQDMEALKEQVRDLAQTAAAAREGEPPARGPGRPPKAQAA